MCKGGCACGLGDSCPAKGLVRCATCNALKKALKGGQWIGLADCRVKVCVDTGKARGRCCYCCCSATTVWPPPWRQRLSLWHWSDLSQRLWELRATCGVGGEPWAAHGALLGTP